MRFNLPLADAWRVNNKKEKEYYINDAGRQIDILTASVILKLVRSDINNYFPKKNNSICKQPYFAKNKKQKCTNLFKSFPSIDY